MIDLKKITNGVKLKFVDTNEYLKFLEFCARGNINRFSPENQVLIYGQNKDAELLVPFDDWRKVGRYPKAKTGVHIFKTELLKVNAGCVFDIKDTIGKEFRGYIKPTKEDLPFLAQLFGCEVENFDETVEKLTRTYVRANMKIERIGFLTEEMVCEMIEDISLFMIKKHCGLEHHLSESTMVQLNQLTEFTQMKVFFDVVQSKVQAYSRMVIRKIDTELAKKRKEEREHGTDNDRTYETRNDDRSTDIQLNGGHDGGRSNEISGGTRSEISNVRDGNIQPNRMDGRTRDGIYQAELSGALLSNDDRGRDVTIRTETSRRSERIDEGNRGQLFDESQSRGGDGLSGNRETPQPGETGSNRDHSERSVVSSTGADLLTEKTQETSEVLRFDETHLDIEVEKFREVEDELNEATRGFAFEDVNKEKDLEKDFETGQRSNYSEEVTESVSDYKAEMTETSVAEAESELVEENVEPSSMDVRVEDIVLAPPSSETSVPADLFDHYLIEGIGGLNKYYFANSTISKDKKEQLVDAEMYYCLGEGGTLPNTDNYQNISYKPLKGKGVCISWSQGGVRYFGAKSIVSILNRGIKLVEQGNYLTEHDFEVYKDWNASSVLQSAKWTIKKDTDSENQKSIESSIESGDIVTKEDKEYMVYESKEKTTLVAKDGSEVLRVPNEQIKDATILSGDPIPFFYGEDWKPTTGSDKERFRENIDAIKLLKQIESEHRYATKEEQDILSHYVGWGGLSNAFDENNSAWRSEYEELKGLLTQAEYEAARGSVTDSFYTPREVVDGVYKALKHLGFTGGNILEPSCGIGNFFASMPSDFREKVNCYGVELDSVSGRIAQLLHPKAKIKVMGFEKADIPDNFYDVVIGNVPFGNFKVYDKKYKNQNFLIHDYFFAKALDKVAPGGLVCLITSKGTMDKQNPKIRKYLAERADLIGAIRLPNSTFKASANTEATSDILILQKKEVPIINEPEWCYLGYIGDDIPVNSYFMDHPQMLLGTMEKDTSRFGEDRTLTYLAPFKDEDLGELIQGAIRFLPENIYDVKSSLVDETEMDEAGMLPATPDVKNNSFTVVDNKIYFRQNANLVPYKPKNTKQGERIKGLCELRELTHALIEAQVKNCTDEELSELQSNLNTKYDKFVKKNGFISDNVNRSAFDEDVEYPFLTALEEKKEDTYVKSAIFTKRTIKPKHVITSADSAIDAFYMCLNEYGYVKIERIMELYPEPFEKVEEELRDVMFRDPALVDDTDEYSGYVTRDEYLSGNVRQKLRIAEERAKENPKYLYNVERLKEVQPRELEADEISVRIGTTWIDVEDYKAFLCEVLNIQGWRRDNLSINFVNLTNSYSISNKNVNYYYGSQIEMTEKFGTTRMNALEIFDKLSKSFMVDFDETGSIGKRYRRQDEVGTPYCITYDFDSESTGKVTVRDRDTMQQELVDIDKLEAYIADKIKF